METAHSKTNRAKKPAPKIVVNQWDDVWRSFKERHKHTTIESMESNGWKLLVSLAEEIRTSRQAIHDLVNSGKMEKTKEKIQFSGKIREMVFVRPKLTISQ
jgi:predicted DNA-binding protein YlxM (UPF0122 family)